MPRQGAYVDNAKNRSLGRVGMSYGTASSSSSTNSSQSFSTFCSVGAQSNSRVYVDNSMNRRLGRVGMTHGTASVSSTNSNAVSSSGYGSLCSPGNDEPKRYVDNAQNRNLGRVGMVHGTASVSSSKYTEKPIKGLDDRMKNVEPKVYVDNAMNRKLGRVGMAHGAASSSNKQQPPPTTIHGDKTYVDNALNRSLGRVGMSHGVAPVSHGAVKAGKVYVNNYLNRKLGRVGKPLGSMSVSMNERKENIQSALRRYEHDMENKVPPVVIINQQPAEIRRHEIMDSEDKETILEMIQRLTEWRLQSEAKRKEYSQRSTRFDSRRARPPFGDPEPVSQSTFATFEKYEGAIIEFDDITLDERDKIGHGGFGDIFAGTWEGKRVAVKKLRVQRVSKKRLSQFEEEVKLFCKLDHKNIIEFYGACIKTPNLCIVMELMKCSLHDSIHQHQDQYTDEGKLYITSEIADGIDYLHSKNISHCDIKTKNILLDIFDNFQMFVKVADFGLSLMKNETESVTSSLHDQRVRDVGTPRYSAPEVLRGELLDVNGMQMSDIYSYGLVLFELYSEEEPFDEMNVHQLRTHVGFGSHIPPLDKIEGCDEHLIEMMRSCWKREPTRRPKMSQIRKDLSKVVIREKTGVLIEV